MDELAVQDMIDAAGMVLLQVYSESGRSSLIFKDVEAIFGSIAKLPPSIFWAGMCLQISARCYSEAQLSIETFLKERTYSTLEYLYFHAFKPASRHYGKSFGLSPERYVQIIDLYCVEVLAKGLGKLSDALQRVAETDLPAGNKQDIIKKLNKLAVSMDRPADTSLSGYPEKTSRDTSEYQKYFSKSRVSGSEEINSDATSSKEVIRRFDSDSSLKNIFLLSPIMDYFSGWMSSSSMNRSGVPRWKMAIVTLKQRKLQFGGAAVIFIMIAIYRRRYQLSRLFHNLGKAGRLVLSAIFISLRELWDVAFSVQVNPLAAVQPLPSTFYGG
ncbi:hypothetical protein KP509_30G013100 [Ceratopteris richardii]|nr:hypothetical protein KP509_30G013100 [Ceratopteris richardii]